MHVIGGPTDINIYVIANAHWEAHDFALPVPSLSKRWYRFVDTMRAVPYLYLSGRRGAPPHASHPLPGRASFCGGLGRQITLFGKSLRYRLR